VTYRLVDVENEADWHAYHAIRRSVLWEARGRSNYDARHEGEYRPNRYPLLLKLAGRSIGTTRLDDFGGAVAAVRLVAIVSDAHRQGHGRKLMELVEGRALALGRGILSLIQRRMPSDFMKNLAGPVRSGARTRLLEAKRVLCN
jgi:GNAT superfamily N-acetyltransferase